jgi:hypothetical protein
MARAASAPIAFRIEDALAHLERTPRVLRVLLAGLPPEWVHANYGADTFSPFDVVGHLIHGERADWIPRLRRILEHGESVPFDPFDRFAHYEESAGKDLEDLLTEFARLRSAGLAEVRAIGLGAKQLELRGRHPSLGPVTVRELLSTWVVHDWNHVKQIARALAWQYRSDVGPWAEYLPILAPP